MRTTLIISTLALLLVTPAAFGQAQRGSVTVSVTDADNAALPGATVSIESDQTLTRRTAIADAQGQASLLALAPATNYIVTVSLDGFASQTVAAVQIRAGLTQTLAVQLGLADVTEELIVTSESPLVDVTKTQAGQDITLQLTEALPTTRGYQGYLQLVPGVQDAIGITENPASRSGVNYRDAHRDGEGDIISTDNVFYFDGINVTDNTNSTFGAQLNTEVIQE
ncbi:MAG: carboxypeptidase-like regulatory domain-containing protein, partial [Thermoanaerobaculia bacterium]